MSKRVTGYALVLVAASMLGGCEQNITGERNAATEASPRAVDQTEVLLASDGSCFGFCQNIPTNLTVADVQTVIAQAAQEASARGTPATIAVVDRVGNVLAVYKMSGAADTFTITTGTAPDSGLEDVTILPSELAAIAKAVTGAYLSSEGNAFSSRTASHIVQQYFSPHEIGQPGGPLFGVQFSNLPCSDLNTRFPIDGTIGPKRTPLGFSADPGGMPLYKDGTPVGGIGVIADGVYSLDRNIIDFDQDVAGVPTFGTRDEIVTGPGFPSYGNLDETIATAGTFGYAAPADRRADRITVDGRALRFSDAEFDDLLSVPAVASFADAMSMGSLVAVPNYTDGTLQAGTPYSHAPSGIESASVVDPTFADLDGYFLTDGAGNNRYPARNGSDADRVGASNTLKIPEVRAILRSALLVANRARGQIRRPLGSQARVTISVVDSDGVILGIIRTRDAPMFGTDVSLQKARTAAFFSNPVAADDLLATPDTDVLDVVTPYTSSVAAYVDRVRDFFDDPTALTGTKAFADRSGGNLSRPFYPDGVTDNRNGPLSLPLGRWSPFSTGLQLDLVLNVVVGHLLATVGAAGGEAESNPPGCTQLPEVPGLGVNRLRNGIQIFPGSVPIYRGDVLIGGIGVSGDGIEQDDMISFLGLHNASIVLADAGVAVPPANAPRALRADTITPSPSTGFTERLRFIQCPQNPFLNSNEPQACDGL